MCPNMSFSGVEGYRDWVVDQSNLLSRDLCFFSDQAGTASLSGDQREGYGRYFHSRGDEFVTRDV